MKKKSLHKLQKRGNIGSSMSELANSLKHSHLFKFPYFIVILLNIRIQFLYYKTFAFFIDAEAHS